MEKIYITNFRQASAYISDGVQPIEMKYDLKKKVMVFIFRKEDTAVVWQKWMNGEYRNLFERN